MTTSHVKTDPQIQAAVIKELDWSPNIGAEHIGVAVSGGAVTLSGEVGSLPERDAAVAAAMRIHSVRALADEIVVERHDGRYNDVDVARVANTLLGNHVQLPGTPIRATVHEQVVTLSGTVDWPYQRAAARQAVCALGGVVDVIDSIAVRVQGVQADAEQRITDAFERGARRDAHNIQVSVEGHVARLSGHVYSWKESHEAEGAALSARGITSVRNERVIVP